MTTHSGCIHTFERQSTLLTSNAWAWLLTVARTGTASALAWPCVAGAGCPRRKGRTRVVRRWRRRRQLTRRAQLAADAANLAGLAHLVLDAARRQGADVPEGVAACPLVWSRWAERLDQWAEEGERQ